MRREKEVIHCHAIASIVGTNVSLAEHFIDYVPMELLQNADSYGLIT